MKKRFLLLSLLMTAMSANILAQEIKTVFTDDFERDNLSPGGTPALTYESSIVVHSGDDPLQSSISSTAKTLLVRNKQGIGAGRIFTYSTLADYDEAFSNKIGNVNADSISWAFNLRHTAHSAYFTENTSGFEQSQNGIATVLLSTSADIETASGYAVVAGDITYGQRHRLVKFENGLNSNSKLTNIASSVSAMSGAIGGADYHAFKVVYIKATNTWKLYFKGKTKDNPNTLSEMTLVAEGSDNTFVNTEMTHFGFLNNYYTVTKGDRMILWDNYTVTLHADDFSTSIETNKEEKPYVLHYGNNGLTIEVDNAQITLYSLSGAKIKSTSIQGSHTLEGLNDGIYLVKILLGDGQSYIEKFAVK